MININELKFDENGLIPAVVVDAINGEVLTLAYMNKESLEVSIEKGLTCFWSRSRNELWLKGETSGNYQHIVKMVADCDSDALLVYVKKDGPACHTGSESCFNDIVFESDEEGVFSPEALFEMIKGRKTEKKEGSYTKVPSGLPSIQQSLPVLLTIAYSDGIPLTRIASVFSENASELYGLDRGKIKRGYAADLVIFDYSKEFIVKAEDQLSKCGWTPYEGETLRGVIETVFIDGKPVG